MTRATRIVFPAQGEIGLERAELPAVADGEVRVRALLSLVSTGTELLALDQTFSAAGTNQAEWMVFPFHPGYATIGTVDESKVAELPVGTRVAIRHPHASHTVVPAADCYAVPDALDPADAVWFALAKIAYRGIQVGRLGTGDSLAVIGAGPVGQMVVRWATAVGARDVVVVDPIEPRLEIAADGGATAGIAARLDDAGDQLAAALESRRLKAILDSTGNPAVITSALEAAPDGGAVVIFSDGGRPDEITLTSGLTHRALTLAGAFDEHDTDGVGERAIVDLFFHLVASGRFPLDRLITHRVEPERCREMYELARARPGQVLGIAFDWVRSAR